MAPPPAYGDHVVYRTHMYYKRPTWVRHQRIELCYYLEGDLHVRQMGSPAPLTTHKSANANVDHHQYWPSSGWGLEPLGLPLPTRFPNLVPR